MLYQLYETQRALMEPFSDLARFAAKSGADTICNAAIFMDSIAVARITKASFSG